MASEPLIHSPGGQVDPPVVTRAPGLGRRRRRIGPALRRRRRLRSGIVQLVYVAGAVALGIVIPRISVGSPVPGSKATEMLLAVGAGLVPFIGIVYSMRFLVVQFGSTTFTPRLNLFRDDPIVWHAFSFFTAVIAFAFTATFRIGAAPHTTLLIPIALGIAVLVAIGLPRSLQAAAFKSIQLASILEQLCRRSRVVIDGVHPETMAAPDDGGRVSDDGASSILETSGDARDVLWPGHSSVSDREVLKALQLGPERTFDLIQRSHCACLPISHCARCRLRSTIPPPRCKRSTPSLTSYASSFAATSESKWSMGLITHSASS